MGDLEPRSSHVSTFDDFEKFLRSNTLTGLLCRRPYVRISRLKRWLNIERVTKLLCYAYIKRYPERLLPPIDASVVCTGDNSCALVFSILLELGLGHRIGSLQGRDLCDRRLPLVFSNLSDLGWSLRDTDAFIAKQWAFCPAVFDFRSQSFTPGRVLPLYKHKQIAEGGTAQVWEIVVPEEFVAPGIKQQVPGSRFEDEMFGYCYQFAVKTFRDSDRSATLFENEKEAFQALRKHEGMVRYLGDYEYSEFVSSPLHEDSKQSQGRLSNSQKTRVTYNILLEYGELDLESYFHECLPPVLEGEVVKFWKDMFDVADAVKGIHEMKIMKGGEEQDCYGWHADIKPDNILIVKGKFKLADPGFARIVRKTDKNSAVGRDATIIKGGTTTFGAPECHPSKDPKTPVTRSIDVWSLGCVFSIAATWVVLGYEGTRQFSRFRDNASRTLVKQRMSPDIAKTGVSPVRGDFFHDGEKVLKGIREWHDFLRRYLRPTDNITGRVLDLVKTRMLGGDARTRIEVNSLCDKLKDILPKQTIPELKPAIMQALLQVDDEAPSRVEVTRQANIQFASRLQAPGALPGENSMPTRLDLPLQKTTHRSEYLRSALCEQGFTSGNDQPYMQHAGKDFQTLPITQNQKNAQLSHLHTVEKLHEHQGVFLAADNDPRRAQGPDPYINSGLSRVVTMQQPIKHTPRNVWQAREDIGNGKSWWPKRRGKDEFLAGYFKNRDIVFLVDNAETMAEHWFHAKYLLETLVLKANGQDPDGMDLKFTCGAVTLVGSNDAIKFVKKMSEKGAKPHVEWHTNMALVLAQILGDYLEMYKRHPRKEMAKKLTLIILTDGKWEGMISDPEGTTDIIVNFARKMERLSSGLLGKRERRVSIEFVQFGNDPDATARLRRLDDDLPYKIPDIVDTERADGDVIKMILGSFVEEFDRIDDTMLSPPSTPNRGTSYSNQDTAAREPTPLPDLRQTTSPPVRASSTSTLRAGSRAWRPTDDGTGRPGNRGSQHGAGTLPFQYSVQHQP